MGVSAHCVTVSGYLMKPSKNWTFAPLLNSCIFSPNQPITFPSKEEEEEEERNR